MTERATQRANALREVLLLSEETLLLRVHTLERAAVTLLIEGDLSEDVHLEALTTAHQLISLEMFGIPRGTTLARRAEELLQQQPLPAGIGVELAELALGMREALELALTHGNQPSAGEPAGGAADRSGVSLVLLIEDDPLLAGMLRRSLEEAGVRVTHAATGPAGLEALVADDLPDLVLLDIDLPGLDGYSVLRAMRGRGLLPRVQVVVLSARGSEQDVLQSVELGAVGHVAKPFSLPILLARVEQLIGGN